MSTLYVIPTPIGNLEDLTHRAVRVLGEVDALACEDTRRTGILLQRYEIAKPPVVFSYHEHNETRACERIMGFLEAGQSVGICSNAGCPGISDPGYEAVQRAVAGGFAVEVLPGASVVQAALVASGLPCSSYTFKGFPPRKAGRRRSWLEMERALPHTLVLFEAPGRCARLVGEAQAALGDRRAAACIEMTKRFEKVWRGYLSELHTMFSDAPVKGEVTLVIAGNHPKFVRHAPDSGGRRSGGSIAYGNDS